MKVEELGSNDQTTSYLSVSGIFLNRLSLLRTLKKMSGVTILDKAIIRNYIIDKPLIRFEYKNKEFIVEPEYFAGNELEIRQVESRPAKELVEIKEYLLGL
jgi:hypothetical protein